MTDWIGAILAIGVLIIVHEAGHYVVARLCGMRVERFSLGFGPAIVGWRSKKTGTLFQIGPIPFGGFVEIRGMNLAEDVDPTDHSAYPNRPAWQRFLTIFAGPATNYVFAVVLAFGLFTFAGIQGERYWGVDQLLPNAAATGVLEPGDRILSIDGKPLRHQDNLPAAVNATQGREVVVTIRRDGRVMDVKVAAKPDKDGDKQVYRFGFVPQIQVDRVKVGVVRSAKEALIFPVEQTKMIAIGLYEWISGKVEGEVLGPVGITKTIKTSLEQGWVTMIGMLMVLNVYLGLFNLFPLPALDGGRLVFLAYEMATRRRANPKIETPVHTIGILILMVVMVLVTLKDCAKL